MNPHAYKSTVPGLEPDLTDLRRKESGFDGVKTYAEAERLDRSALVRFWVTRSQPVEVALHATSRGVGYPFADA